MTGGRMPAEDSALDGDEPARAWRRPPSMRRSRAHQSRSPPPPCCGCSAAGATPTSAACSSARSCGFSAASRRPPDAEERFRVSARAIQRALRRRRRTAGGPDHAANADRLRPRPESSTAEGDIGAATLAYYEDFEKRVKEIVKRNSSGAHALEPVVPLDRNFRYETRCRWCAPRWTRTRRSICIRGGRRQHRRSHPPLRERRKAGQSRGRASSRRATTSRRRGTMRVQRRDPHVLRQHVRPRFGHLLGLDHINPKAPLRKKSSGQWTDEDAGRRDARPGDRHRGPRLHRRGARHQAVIRSPRGPARR